MHIVPATAMVLACSASAVYGQIVPTAWARSSAGYVYADDYGWGPGSDSDQFSESTNALGPWTTSSTANCAFGLITNSATIEQSSTISATQLKTSGVLHNVHSTMASSGETDTRASYFYDVVFTLAGPTPATIAFSATETFSNWASTDYAECTMWFSGPGIDEYAGFWPGPGLSPTYSFSGVLPAGSYRMVVSAIHQAASDNERTALDWKYEWSMEMNVVPGPGVCAVGMVVLSGLARRRR